MDATQNVQPHSSCASENTEASTDLEPEVMNCRRITLPDGRYLIFFTFVAASPSTEDANQPGNKRV